MFEWIMFGLVAAVTIGVCITVDALRKAMSTANIDIGEIIDIDRIHNKVTLKDLESRAKITVTGEDISDKIYRGQIIRRKPVVAAAKNEESESLFSAEDEAIFARLQKEIDEDPWYRIVGEQLQKELDEEMPIHLNI